ncbi:IS110 family transposase [Rhodococcus opacus]|uniref:IS110 family transposase n=1 Tax=Rhodococcus opacus TaxID=37919 RepID=UPI003B97FA62
MVMEATSDYWKPVFYLLEAHGLDPWLVNARDVKHLPGRPKTDVLDAVWLCKVAERQMLRPSFVPPRPIRQLRDLTRYRSTLVAARTAENNRIEKLLEDACIKLSVVASDIFGVSGREMMDALIDGQNDPKVLAQMARARMRTKIACLEEALDGHFDHHHAFLLTRMLGRIDTLDADITAVDEQIEAHLAPFAAAARLDEIPDRHHGGRRTDRGAPGPFAAAAARLDEIPGIGPVVAATIIAEVGVDMSRFPTAGHLCSWAKFSPGINSSAGKTKGNGSSGHGNRYLAAALGEAAVMTRRTDTFLGARYRRLAKRGKKRAIVAVGRSILVVVWHLLSDEQVTFHDLGSDHYTRHIHPDTKKHSHIRQLEALGYTVTLAPAA